MLERKTFKMCPSQSEWFRSNISRRVQNRIFYIRMGVLLILLILALVGLNVSKPERQGMFEFFCFIIVALIILPFALTSGVAKGLYQFGNPFCNRIWSVNENGIEWHEESVMVPWSEVKSIKETAEFIHVVQKNGQPITLFKNFLPADVLVEIQKKFQATPKC